jgi:hypothetical protein
MKNILFLICLCVTNQSQASGCMGGYIAGWEIGDTAVVAKETINLNSNEMELSDCNKDPNLTMRIKNAPGIYRLNDLYSRNCMKATEVIKENEGKNVVIIKENISLDAFDDCNWPFGDSARSGRYKIILKDSNGYIFRFHYPYNSFMNPKLETIPEF